MKVIFENKVKHESACARTDNLTCLLKHISLRKGQNLPLLKIVSMRLGKFSLIRVTFQAIILFSKERIARQM